MSPSATTPPSGCAGWQEKPAKRKRGGYAVSQTLPEFLRVGQARLDWVTLVTTAWSEGMTEAWRKYASLTPREAGEVYARLNHDFLELERILADWSDESPEGRRWLELRIRLKRWQGLLAGLNELMRRRPKTPSTGNGAGATSAPWPTAIR